MSSTSHDHVPSGNSPITFKVLKVTKSGGKHMEAHRSAQKCTFRSQVSTLQKHKTHRCPNLAGEIIEKIEALRGDCDFC